MEGEHENENVEMKNNITKETNFHFKITNINKEHYNMVFINITPLNLFSIIKKNNNNSNRENNFTITTAYNLSSPISALL